jgi:hypothetical protein
VARSCASGATIIDSHNREPLYFEIAARQSANLHAHASRTNSHAARARRTAPLRASADLRNNAVFEPENSYFLLNDTNCDLALRATPEVADNIASAADRVVIRCPRRRNELAMRAAVLQACASSRGVRTTERGEKKSRTLSLARRIPLDDSQASRNIDSNMRGKVVDCKSKTTSSPVNE